MTPDARSQMISNTRIEADGMTAAEAEAFLSDTPARYRDAGDLVERMETQHEGRDDVLKAMEDGGGTDQTTGHKKEIPTDAASVNLLERPGEGAGRGSYNPARDGKLGRRRFRLLHARSGMR